MNVDLELQKKKKKKKRKQIDYEISREEWEFMDIPEEAGHHCYAVCGVHATKMQKY